MCIRDRFQRGSIRRGTTFAGDHLHIPLIDPMLPAEGTYSSVSVADEAFFVEPKEPTPNATKPAVAGPSGTPGKEQAAAAPGTAVPAGASAAAAAPHAGSASPDRSVQRIQDVPPTPSDRPLGPPLGMFRLSGPWSPASEVSPAGADMPVPSASTPVQPADTVPVGDTWLDRRR